ncbi:hypothetical protein ES703_96954 [subsurface metagenome]
MAQKIGPEAITKVLYYRRFIFVILAIAYFLGMFHRISPGVMAKELMDTFGIDATAIGLLGGAYFYPYAVAQIPAGVLSDVWGTRRTITAFMAVAGLGTLFTGIAALLRKTVKKEGIGVVLAEGIKHASKEWGIEGLAIHVKGLEPPGYDPRAYKGMGLGYAIADRGACHLRATFYKPELAGMIAPEAIEGKAEMFIWWEDKMSFMDSLIACRFYRDLYTWDHMSMMVKAVTGMNLDEGRMREIASNITNKARDFNLREGMKREDERLPKRLLQEPLADSHKTFSKAEFEKMLSDYYKLKTWSEPPSGDMYKAVR